MNIQDGFFRALRIPYTVLLCVWPLWLPGGPEVYEPFAYAVESELAGQSGGYGFSGVWASKGGVIGTGSGLLPGDGAIIRGESLSYSDGLRTLMTEGGSLHLSGETANAQVARALDEESLPHRGADPRVGKTTYISFLAQRAGEAADPEDPVYGGAYPYGDNLFPRSAGIGFHSWNDGDLLQLFFGNLSNRETDVWRFTGEDLYGDERRDARSKVAFGSGREVRFLVVRIDHGAGGWLGDRLRVWIDPDLSAEEANDAPITFDWTTRDDPLHVQPAILSLEANNGNALRPHAELNFDEFRIGGSWETVTPHTGGASWAGRPVHHSGLVYFGRGFLGWLAPMPSDWAYAWTLGAWIYLPEAAATDSGSWFYLNRSGREMPETTPERSRLHAYEGFDYPSPGADTRPDLVRDGLDGGTGWAASWASANPRSLEGWAEVRDGSLGYSDRDGHELATAGGHAWVSGIPAEAALTPTGVSTRIRRTLADPPSPEPGKPLYLSFVGLREGEPADPEASMWQDAETYPEGYPFGENLYPRNAGLNLYEEVSGGGTSAQLGNLSDQALNRWSLNAESTHVVSERPFTGQTFVVVKFDYTSRREANLRGEWVERVGTLATVWFNPASLIAEDPADAHREVIYKDLVDPFAVAVSGIGLEAGDDSYNRPVAELRLDEIRLGTDWDAVTPVIGGKPPREPAPEREWAGLPVAEGGHVWGGDELQWLWIGEAPWLYCHVLETWIHSPESVLSEPSGWFFAVDLAR